jgi:hypothetical protein
MRHRLAAQRYKVGPAKRARLQPRVAEGLAALAAFLRAACDGRGCRARSVPPPCPLAMALRGPPLPGGRLRGLDRQHAHYDAVVN